jgi:hypothetical protein
MAKMCPKMSTNSSFINVVLFFDISNLQRFCVTMTLKEDKTHAELLLSTNPMKRVTTQSSFRNSQRENRFVCFLFTTMK